MPGFDTEGISARTDRAGHLSVIEPGRIRRRRLQSD
jgi:hypothetical protein